MPTTPAIELREFESEVTKPLTHEQMKELKELFRFFDVEGKGIITPIALSQLFAELGASKTVVECRRMLVKHFREVGKLVPEAQVVEAVEAVEDGRPELGLTLVEFVAFYTKITKQLTPSQELKEAFRVLDDDGDGFIEVSKLCNGYFALGAAPTLAEARTVVYDAFKEQEDGSMMDEAAFWQGTRINYEQFVSFINS